MEKVLLSAEHNTYVQRWETTGDGWSVKKYTLHGGKQDGVDLVEIDNGQLKITVIPTRGMSVLKVESSGIRLGWDSPVKEVVHPKYINLESRGGLGWLDGFNEWMVRCGLEFAGHPGQDRFINNVGDEATMDLTLHGKIGNIPASELSVVVDDRIRVRGQVEERMFYGPQLELTSEISTEPGSMSFRIADTVVNHANNEQEFEMIYHANHGPPLLEEDSRFVAPLERVTPMNDHAAKSVKDFDRFGPPTTGFVEQVYCLYPYADDSANTQVVLHNAAGDRGVLFSYSVDQLPYLTLWKNTLSKENGYVTGIEPGTCFPFNRRIERQAGRLPKLAAGESRDFVLDFKLLGDREAVDSAVSRIQSIQGDRETTIDTEPPSIDN